MPFVCSICEQESTQICEYCTKDTCADHLCTSCLRCSDCCECDVPLTAQPNGIPLVEEALAELAPVTEEEPQQPEGVPLAEEAPEQDPAPEPGA